MKVQSKIWWRLGKWLLAAVILIFVGVRIVGDLRQLDRHEVTLHPGWLAATALLYLAGLGCAGIFWHRLLAKFGQSARLLPALRAYYVSHLGKYVPGKALALLMRGTIAQTEPVNVGVAVISAFYEVLTTMAAGALVAAILFTIQPPTIGELTWDPVFTGLLLLGLVCVPLMPPVFNRLVRGLAKRFQDVPAFQLPHLRIATLLQGLAMTMCGWGLLGLSLWTLLHAILPEAERPALTLSLWMNCTAMVSLAYVAGFLAIVVPSGVGVREYLLLHLLAPVLTMSAASQVEARAALAVLLLRLVWSLSEVVLAGLLYQVRFGVMQPNDFPRTQT